MDMLDSRYFQDGRQELDLMRTSRLDWLLNVDQTLPN
jgi:hypothetical protein